MKIWNELCHIDCRIMNFVAEKLILLHVCQICNQFSSLNEVHNSAGWKFLLLALLHYLLWMLTSKAQLNYATVVKCFLSRYTPIHWKPIQINRRNEKCKAKTKIFPERQNLHTGMWVVNVPVVTHSQSMILLKVFMQDAFSICLEK